MAILFLDDWLNYPDAAPHYGTHNASFIKLAKYYREIGVKNHLFPLALHNQNLRTVDPHSRDLTLQQIAAIMQECVENPWYFMREVLRANSPGGLGTVPFRGNRSNVGMWWCFFTHVTNITTQPRQTGKSYGCYGLTTYLLRIVCRNTQINLFTKDNKLRGDAVDTIKELMENLPWYMDIMQRDDKNNSEEITVNALGNSYATQVPQASVKAAENVGRGKTSAIWHIDEAPFLINLHHSLPALIGSMGAARESAKANNAPYGLIYTTTAGRQNTTEGAYFYERVKSAATWDEVAMLDAKNEEELHELIASRSKNKQVMTYSVYTHKQLGFTDEWLLRQISEVGFEPESREKLNMDYFNIWVSGSDSAAFSPDIARTIGLRKGKPKFVQRTDCTGVSMKWYIEENEIETYMAKFNTVMGVDTSDAGGGDSMGVVIVNIETFEVVATINTNYVNIFTFAKLLTDLIVKFPNMTTIIERRSSGAAIMDQMLVTLPEQKVNPFERLFNLVVQETDNNKERYQELKRTRYIRDDLLFEHKAEFGFPTSGGGDYGRSVLYGNNFQTSLEQACDRLVDIELSTQLLSLRVKNERIDHPPGGNDDSVIAWLLCMWLLRHGKNLSHYGINSDKIYARGNMVNRELTVEELREHERQERLQEELVRLFGELEGTDDDTLAFRLEQEIRVLSRKIKLEERIIYSVDQLIKAANENRRRRIVDERYMTGA